MSVQPGCEVLEVNRDDKRHVARAGTQLVEDVNTFTEETLKFKDRALLWVYVTEWLVVSGTFLMASFVVWSLMVKRRLYREVKQTRLRLEGDLR